MSKFHPLSSLQQAYEAGERRFGESHVQELLVKQQQMPDDVEWHFIGHLQTNKVRQIVPFVSLIHAVDSLKLLNVINSEAARVGRIVKCLLEVRIAAENTKYGFLPDELVQMLEDGEWNQLPFVQLCGLMCMASNTDDRQQISSEFERVHQLFLHAKQNFFAHRQEFRILSMGMSGDWPIAIDCGSNMVRIGSSIFGERNY